MSIENLTQETVYGEVDGRLCGVDTLWEGS
jgi:hypothetical protein